MRRLHHRFTRLSLAIVLTIIITLPTLATPSIASFGKEPSRTAVECGSITDPSSVTQHLSLSTTADGDLDGLTDTTEIERTFTNPCDQDTDDDGLVDSWEVDPAKVDPQVDRAGFDLNDDGVVDATRDEVFGPYAEPDGQSQTLPDGRLSVLPFALFVQRPAPLYKDIYFELDWQDCKVIDGDCPEPFGIRDLDPTHHAPNPDAIQDVLTVFHNAPVTNPDSTISAWPARRSRCPCGLMR